MEGINALEAGEQSGVWVKAMQRLLGWAEVQGLQASSLRTLLAGRRHVTDAGHDSRKDLKALELDMLQNTLLARALARVEGGHVEGCLADVADALRF